METTGLAVKHNFVLGCGSTILHLADALQSRYHVGILLNLGQEISPVISTLSRLVAVRVAILLALSPFPLAFNHVASGRTDKHRCEGFRFLVLLDLQTLSLKFGDLPAGKTVHNLGKHELHGEETSKDN
jgi:hypothetical protein